MPLPVPAIANSATAFQAMGLTTAVNASSAGSAPLDGGSALITYPSMQFFNNTDGPMFVAFHKTTGSADVPVPGTPANGVPIPAGACLVLGVPPGSFYVSYNGTGTSGSVYMTPGAGV